MNYIVYETECIANGKKYRGAHKTEDYRVFDGYLGSAKELKKDIKRYGLESFTRKTLVVCPTPEYADEVETLMTQKEWVERDDTYNRAVGGGTFLCGENHPMYGTSCSGETNKKWRQDIDNDELLKLYNEGYSQYQIADVFNTTQSTVANRLRAIDVVVRQKIKPVIIDGVEYSSGRQAAKKLGISKSTMSYRLRNGFDGYSYA